MFASLGSLLESWSRRLESLLAADALALRTQYVLLASILVACLAVRLATMDAPRLDRTVWKEIDYLNIVENYQEHGFVFWRPEVSWPAEEPRATAMELPLVPFVAALAAEVFGKSAYVLRSPTLLAFLTVVVYVFLFARRELGPAVAVPAAASTATMPLLHSHGHFLFSDPWVIALSVVAVHHCATWIDGGRRRDWIVATGAFSLAVALKLTPLYLGLPLLYLGWRRWGRDLLRYRGLALMVAVGLILPAIWYSWAYVLGRSSIDVFGVFGGHDKMQTFTMLSSIDWYRTLYERISWHLLGGKLGVALCVVGMAATLRMRRGGAIWAYFAAIAGYFAIVAEGQIDGRYRQLTLIPPLAVFVAVGALAVVAGGQTLLAPIARRARRASLVTSSAATTALALALLLVIPIARWELVRGRAPDRAYHPFQWRFAKQLEQLVDPGGPIVALGEYTIHKGGNDLSPVLYHYANVRGWTLQPEDWDLERVEELARRGAEALTAWRMNREPAAAPFLAELRHRYPLLYETKRGFILDLRRRLPESRG
jgi:hypothetical protein